MGCSRNLVSIYYIPSSCSISWLHRKQHGRNHYHGDQTWKASGGVLTLGNLGIPVIPIACRRHHVGVPKSMGHIQSGRFVTTRYDLQQAKTRPSNRLTMTNPWFWGCTLKEPSTNCPCLNPVPGVAGSRLSR